jgi:hypothetical protein
MTEAFSPSEWPRLTTPCGTVSISAPPAWEQPEDVPGVALAVVEPPEDDEFRANVNVVITPTPVTDLEEVVADGLEQIARVLVELQVVDACALELEGGRVWGRVLMAYRGATHPLTLEQRTTIVDGVGAVVLSATADTNAWASKEHVLMEILDSAAIGATSDG